MTRVYKKSSFSGSTDNCVEVSSDLASFRDTKHRDVEMPVAGLPVFIAMMAAGQFTLPTVR